MRVRMKPGTCSAGPWGVLTAGSDYDLPDHVAAGLVAGGYAEALDAPAAPAAAPEPPPSLEVAAVEAAPETASQPRPARRRRG